MMENEIPKYKKKSKKRTPKKHNHAHDWQPCVYEYQERVYWAPNSGPQLREELGLYCSICGKTNFDRTRWVISTEEFNPRFGRVIRQELTMEGKTQLNRETRTYPTIHLDADNCADAIFTKYIELPKIEEEA